MQGVPGPELSCSCPLKDLHSDSVMQTPCDIQGNRPCWKTLGDLCVLFATVCRAVSKSVCMEMEMNITPRFPGSQISCHREEVEVKRGGGSPGVTQQDLLPCFPTEYLGVPVSLVRRSLALLLSLAGRG